MPWERSTILPTRRRDRIGGLKFRRRGARGSFYIIVDLVLSGRCGVVDIGGRCMCCDEQDCVWKQIDDAPTGLDSTVDAR